MSEMVARTGWPDSPNTSQNVTGLARERRRVELRSRRGARASFGDSCRPRPRPARSPLTSAMNVGTPMREKRSASTCRRDGLAGAGGAGDQAVAVGEARQQIEVAAVGVRANGKGLRHRAIVSDSLPGVRSQAPRIAASATTGRRSGWTAV